MFLSKAIPVLLAVIPLAIGGGLLWATGAAHPPLGATSTPPARKAAVSSARLDPVATLAQVRDHYQRLSSFSMGIEHQDSSGLYPGRYTQLLRWRRGGQFDLHVTSPENKGLAEQLIDGQPRAVPDFFADGTRVISLWPSGRRSDDPEAPQANSDPGWDVTGGPILS